MKTKNLLIISAVGLGAIYLLKEKPEIMGGGTAGGGFLNLSGLFEGLGDAFKSVAEYPAELYDKTKKEAENIYDKTKEGFQDLIPNVPSVSDIIPKGWFENLTGSIGKGLGRSVVSFPVSVVKGVISKSQEVGKEIAEKVTIPATTPVIKYMATHQSPQQRLGKLLSPIFKKASIIKSLPLLK